MRFSLVVISTLFLSCCFDAIPVMVSPVDCYRVFKPDLELEPFVRQAAVRWEKATGCVVEVSVGEAAGGIPVTLREKVVDRYGVEVLGITYLTGCKAKRILISEESLDRYQTISHEMGHALAGHCGPPPVHSETGLMKAIAGEDVIDSASLGLICAGFDCKEFNVEGM